MALYIVTKLNSGNNPTYQEEYYKQYYYHSDHLGSASLISDYKGDEYQRIEYTPYGETWVEKTSNTGLEFLPYKFTAKELDPETGLYYYGSRYLDPRYSRWISTDPALGEYIPQAPIDEEAKKYNQNLPGMGGVFNTVNASLYHYAGNNPVKYIDPDGRKVKNNTTCIVIVKPEDKDDPYVFLKPDQKYEGEQDGVLCPDGTTLKCHGKAIITIKQHDNGNFYFKGGGISKFFGNIIKFLKNRNSKRKRDEDYYGDNYLYQGNETLEKDKFLHSWWENEKIFDIDNDGKGDTKGEIPLPSENSVTEFEDFWKKLGGTDEN